MHITASVFINDDESGLHHDYEMWIERLAPHAPISQYQHNRTGEDACPGRTGPPTRTLSGTQLSVARDGARRAAVVAVTDGRLDFGTWERIFYGEFYGRQRKRVLVKIIGE
jgi:thiamine phosphate synthase YjbQ (UPF0047 family)